MDDANSTEPNNVEQRVEQFVTVAQNMAAHIEGNDIMFTMGGMSSDYPRLHAAEQSVEEIVCIIKVSAPSAGRSSLCTEVAITCMSGRSLQVTSTGHRHLCGGAISIRSSTTPTRYGCLSAC